MDLIYLDPPFNSARNYNVIFSRGSDANHEVGAQIEPPKDQFPGVDRLKDVCCYENRPGPLS